jgi:hypothetical protein
MKEKEIEMDEKLGFLEGFGAALKEELHTDILIKPGNGPSIPAHRALLVTFKYLINISCTIFNWLFFFSASPKDKRTQDCAIYFRAIQML